MSKLAKPIPVPNEDSKPYWEGCNAGKLLIQRCKACATPRFYPRIVCGSCGSMDSDWIETTGRGSVFSYSIIHRAPSPAFKDDVPYVLAIVELEEGVRMMTNVVKCDVSTVAIGMPVQVVFDRVSEEIAVPKFVPAEK